MQTRIIVNADDLGLNAKVNQAIFELISRGRVTSATLLANGAAVEEAARRLREFTQASFGVHLNASELQPLAPTPGLAPILDERGCFAGNRLREIPITRSLRQALFIEWSAQVRRLLDLGVPLSHIDGHHHMHTVPVLFPVLKRVQSEFGLTKVRISMNIYPRTNPPPKDLLMKKALWNTALRYWGITKTTAGFTSLETFCDVATELPNKHETIELMVHPGNPGFASETAILSKPWEEQLPSPVRFVSYLDI